MSLSESASQPGGPSVRPSVCLFIVATSEMQFKQLPLSGFLSPRTRSYSIAIRLIQLANNNRQRLAAPRRAEPSRVKPSGQ